MPKNEDVEVVKGVANLRDEVHHVAPVKVGDGFIPLHKVPALSLVTAFVQKNLAFAKAHTVEATGHNDGEQIDRVEKVWGIKGEPYCAMGQYYAFAKAFFDLNMVGLKPADAAERLASVREKIAEWYLEFSPACADMIAAAKRREQWVEFGPEFASRMASGDLVFFNFGPHSKPHRHVGMVVRWDGSHIVTVEWNTVAGPEDESSDPKGFGGCFVKHRAPDAGTIEGFIAWGKNQL